MANLPHRLLLFALAFLAIQKVIVPSAAASGPATLTAQLASQDPDQLAADARTDGDARRGAIIFYQSQLACAKCHDTAGAAVGLGPDLASPLPGTTPAYLVRAILTPSRDIRAGYEAVHLLLADGTTRTGRLLADEVDAYRIQDPSRGPQPERIPKSQVDERLPATTSLMPENLADQLGGRQQFLDLLRYVLDVSAGGPEVAARLRPASLATARKLPAYENDLDHARLIADLHKSDAENKAAYDRGREIFRRTCANCHGTHDRPGSLPTSRNFTTGTLRNGADPYRLYRTLTDGFGLMAPQVNLVPRQKYDVIHYLREDYLRPHNPSQYVAVEDEYLASLPPGTSLGPEPSEFEPWVEMNYGPHLIASYEVGTDATNFAYKGIAVRLDPGPGGISRGNHFMLYDHDTLRLAAAWSGPGFIDYEGIMFNGAHEIHPRLVGDVHVANPTGPGSADPTEPLDLPFLSKLSEPSNVAPAFADPRLRGRDDRPYGPLPDRWAHYHGLYHYGDQVILSYSIGDADILESPVLLATDPHVVYGRRFHISPHTKPLYLQFAHRTGAIIESADQPVQRNRFIGSCVKFYRPSDQSLPGGSPLDAALRRLAADEKPPTNLYAAIGRRSSPPLRFVADNAGNLRLYLPPNDESVSTIAAFASVSIDVDEPELLAILYDLPEFDLTTLTDGGPPRWPQPLTTQVEADVASAERSSAPFAVDVLTDPTDNPWLCRLRFTGLDFYPDTDALAVCTWDGDVWRVDGLDHPAGELTWRRIASGLFQPLGLRIIDGQIYLTCRDQLVILRDKNGDGETDYYECFNRDHQVTEHFHEFAMGLQTDDAGNFYYAKSARHAKKALVPHHGTLLRIAADGSRTDVLATGFRAANGVCLNPDGTFIVTDQEGHWNPKNRINWVTPGGFYGNMWGYHEVTDPSDSAMEQPLCWITNRFDRSPAELLWVPPHHWGPLAGSLLNLSYGYGKIFVVPHERLAQQISPSGSVEATPLVQGGMAELPIPQLPTGLIRARFRPADGHLYTCGMFAWAGNQTQPGGLYRIRYTGAPIHAPVQLRARTDRLHLTFTDPLDPAAATASENFTVRTWSLRRTADYGSDHYDERMLTVAAAEISADRRTVTLRLPDLAPTQSMSVDYRLRTHDGRPLPGLIHNTIHALPAAGAAE